MALRLSARAALLTVSLLTIQGCTVGGSDSPPLDNAIVTAAVPDAPAAFQDEELAGDGQAILGALAGRGETEEPGALPWENPDSGARGLITAYGGEKREGRECLAFTTTHENFNGIGLFRGTACEDAGGALRIREFDSL